MSCILSRKIEVGDTCRQVPKALKDHPSEKSFMRLALELAVALKNYITKDRGGKWKKF